MKKFLSSLLAAVMVVGSMATVAFADEETTGTITVYNKDGVKVEGTYTTIDSAATAAGVDGKIELSEGTFEFSGRQTIQVEGVDLIGAGMDKTFIVPSSSYAASTETNRKALLTITADDVEIKDLSIDGSVYGDTIDMGFWNQLTGFTDFIVVRINSGDNVKLTNVSVEGSKKSLISVGMATTVTDEVNVTATNLVCNAEIKTIPANALTKVYADVNIKNATFTLKSGTVDGFIALDWECAGKFNNEAAGHYTLIQDADNETSNITSTIKHYVRTYSAASSSKASAYVDAIKKSENIETVGEMVTEAEVYGTDKADIKSGLKNILQAAYDAIGDETDATAITLLGYIGRL